MTPEQLETVASTAARVEARSERFSGAFYDHLFTNWPATRALFPDDLTEQRVKLADEVVFLAEVASDFQGFAARTRELGARHAHYGVKVDHYAAVESALLAALAAVLGDGFTAEVSAAWRRLYAIVVETMLDGARGDVFAGP
jgi:hemoglobin-like flavoprotein